LHLAPDGVVHDGYAGRFIHMCKTREKTAVTDVGALGCQVDPAFRAG
jgi:hypothetical protein